MFDNKEFNDFLKIAKTIELSNEEKAKLKNFWKDSELIDKTFTKIKNQITNKILTENISADFVKGAIYTLGYLKWMIK